MDRERERNRESERTQNTNISFKPESLGLCFHGRASDVPGGTLRGFRRFSNEKGSNYMPGL